MARVHCRDCRNYPEWHRQPGSDMCVSVASERSMASRPCVPRLRAGAIGARLQQSGSRRSVKAASPGGINGQPSILGRVIVWLLVIFGLLLLVIKFLPVLL